MAEMKKTLLVGSIYGILAGLLSITLPLFLDSQGYSIESIGWIFAAAAIISGILGIGLGALSDRFGRRPLIMVYHLLIGVAAGIIGWGGSLYSFIAGKSLSDFSTGGLWNILISRVSDISELKNRAFQFGKYIFLFGIFYAIAHYLAGSVIESFGFQMVFLVIIGFAILGTVVTFFFVEKGKRKEKHHFSLEILKTRNGRAQSLTSFFYGLSNGLLYTYVIYLFLADQFSFDAVQVGLFITATSAIWGITSYIIGKKVDGFGMRKSFFICSLLNGAVWLGVSFFYQDFWPFLVFMVLDNIFYAALDISIVKAASVIPKEENLGRDVSVFGYSHGIGAILALSVAGMIAAVGYEYVFALRGITIILAGLVFWFGIRFKEGEE